MVLGLSLMPYSYSKYCTLSKMLNHIGIRVVEIPYCNYIEDISFLSNLSPYSVHAPKFLFQLDEDEVLKQLMQLRIFCEKLNCNRIVFHPHNSMETNKRFFFSHSKLLSYIWKMYRKYYRKHWKNTQNYRRKQLLFHVGLRSCSLS